MTESAPRQPRLPHEERGNDQDACKRAERARNRPLRSEPKRVLDSTGYSQHEAVERVDGDAGYERGDGPREEDERE